MDQVEKKDIIMIIYNKIEMKVWEVNQWDHRMHLNGDT